MFLTLGERIGVVSHIASFWRYRFPAHAILRVKITEAIDIAHDFWSGLAEPNVSARAA